MPAPPSSPTLLDTHDLHILADYHQIHVSDMAYDGDPGGLWTDDAVANMLAIETGIVVIGTVSDMDVKVRVEMHKAKPQIEGDWDQIAECFIECPSRIIRIMGCTDYEPDAFTVNTPSETMCVRILWGALASVDMDAVEGDDHYMVQMWSGEPRDTTYSKRWRKPE